MVESNEDKLDLDTFKSKETKENTEISNLQTKIELAYLKASNLLSKRENFTFL